MSSTNVSTEDLELLQLLLSGLRDDEVAGRLFMSVRTMRRRLSADHHCVVSTSPMPTTRGLLSSGRTRHACCR